MDVYIERVSALLSQSRILFEELKKDEHSIHMSTYTEVKLHDETIEIYYGTLNILENIYRKNSLQTKELVSEYNNISNLKTRSIDERDAILLKTIIGILSNLKVEIKGGLITSIEKSISKEILTDFVSFSKEQYSEGDLKISSVLICAALEDSLKRIAEINGLDVDRKSMSQVVNALKAKGLIQKSEGTLLGNYTDLRNKVFHADWDSFNKSEIGSLLGFTEQFIKDNFK